VLLDCAHPEASWCGLAAFQGPFLFAAKLRRLAGRRTVIAVAHRFESTADADQIVMMKKGRIEETQRANER
jgi:ABC-type protease/lipase transport system fused ATPase/permease subunit